jgi:hypothetical protein
MATGHMNSTLQAADFSVKCSTDIRGTVCCAFDKSLSRRPVRCVTEAGSLSLRRLSSVATPVASRVLLTLWAYLTFTFVCVLCYKHPAAEETMNRSDATFFFRNADRQIRTYRLRLRDA